MDLYRLLFILAIVAFIVINIVLMIARPLKTHYSYNITKDDLLKSHKDEFGFNYIYSTSGETRQFINKYVVRVNHSTKTLICNYTKFFQNISYYIVCMRKGKPFKVLRVNEKNTKTKTSMIFLLPPQTKTVNVVICEADGVSYNDKVIAPIPRSNCRLYTLLSGINLLSVMYIIRHLIIEIYGTGYQEIFIEDAFNIITLGLMFAIFIVYLITTSRGLRKRNWKTKVGGTLEYEFF